jgi:hypothetical protein
MTTRIALRERVGAAHAKLVAIAEEEAEGVNMASVVKRSCADRKEFRASNRSMDSWIVTFAR